MVFDTSLIILKFHCSNRKYNNRIVTHVKVQRRYFWKPFAKLNNFENEFEHRVVLYNIHNAWVTLISERFHFLITVFLPWKGQHFQSVNGATVFVTETEEKHVAKQWLKRRQVMTHMSKIGNTEIFKVMYIYEAHPHAPFVDLMLSTQIQPFQSVVHLDQLIHKRTFTFCLAKVWWPSQFD